MDIQKSLPGIKGNISLKNYTTFKIGGAAKYFLEIRKKEDLVRAITMAKRFNLPFFILGGGSNLLISDNGFKGLVIKMQNAKCKMKIQNSKFKIFVESGCPLSKLLRKLVNKSLTGLEWTVGIPGTIGGAIYGNAGAFGSSISNILESTEVLDIQNNVIPKFKILKNRDCQFSYRDSIFKKNKALIIFSAVLQLKKENKKEIEERMKKNLEQRKKSQPLNFPSAGSVFKNFSLVQNEALAQKPILKVILSELKRNDSIPAAYLIERCGLKGKRIGDVEISERHANFIINLGNGRAKDVIELIKLVKKKVKNKFGLELKEEIQFLGF